MNAKREHGTSMAAGEKNSGDITAFAARLGDRVKGGEKSLPPVDKWNPPFCGEIDMEIRADGSWFYMGTPIGRAPLVRLFSTVLRKDEDGATYLVTPVEKVKIRVVDAHFIAGQMQVDSHGGKPVLTFETNVGDRVEAGKDHPIRFAIDADDGAVKPYLGVRGRLEALVTRALTYDLIAMAEHFDIDGEPWLVLRSGDGVFPVMKSADLDKALQQS